MLDELIKEINELRDYKQKYEYAEADKKVMSDKLYEYMLKEYENTPYEERCKQHLKHTCSVCRYRIYGCDLQNNLPENIRKPVESDKAWIPGVVSCSSFEWS